VEQTITRATDEVRHGLTVTPEGIRRIWVRIVVPGTVLDYSEKGYTAEIPVDVAGNPEDLKTMIGKPIFFNHPDTDITPSLIETDSWGIVLETEIREGVPYALAQIHTQTGIDWCESQGWQFTVSPGYLFSRGPSDRATFAQTGRYYDHLTIVDERVSSPRGGPLCRSLLRATDSISTEVQTVTMTKEDLVKEMIAEGMAEEKALALADKILAAMVKVEVEPAAEMDMEKPMETPAADMGHPMKTEDMSAEMKAKDAKIKALETQLVQANLRSLRPSIQRACDAVKIGVGADLQKVCDELAVKAGTQYKGRDSQLFVEGMAHGLSVTGEKAPTPAPIKTKAADTKPPSVVAPPSDKANDAKADPLAFS
jgi:hypothetical protein